MADFDATRIEEAKQRALDYLNDRRLELPRAHELAVVIEAQERQLEQLRAALLSVLRPHEVRRVMKA